MVPKNVFLVLLVLGILSSQVLQTSAFVDSALLSEIVKQLFSLWRSGEVEFLGNQCEYRIRPKIRKWKLKYEGKFWCSGWAGFTGRSLKSSRSGSVEHAIRDFANKAMASDLATKEEIQHWLQRYNG